jgi:hypothetical protein
VLASVFPSIQLAQPPLRGQAVAPRRRTKRTTAAASVVPLTPSLPIWRIVPIFRPRGRRRRRCRRSRRSNGRPPQAVGDWIVTRRRLRTGRCICVGLRCICGGGGLRGLRLRDRLQRLLARRRKSARLRATQVPRFVFELLDARQCFSQCTGLDRRIFRLSSGRLLFELGEAQPQPISFTQLLATFSTTGKLGAVGSNSIQNKFL